MKKLTKADPPQTVYVNRKQEQFLQARQKRRSFVGGRGSGKTSVAGHQTRMEMNYLPKAKFFLAGLTYNQLLQNTVPAMEKSWKAHNLCEYDPKLGFGHYVIGKRPPDDWPKPYNTPRNYENVISTISGYTIQLLSMDRPETARGGSYDGGHIDESALIKHEHVTKILTPMIRGNIYRFSHYLHQTFCDYTSVPWLPSGQWVFNTEEEAKTKPEEFFFLESTAYDNLDVLGEKYLSSLRSGMSQLEWDVEVMNQRLTKLPDAFYPALNEERHGIWKTYSYEYDEETGLTLPTSTDRARQKPIETSWDFNAAFTSLIVCQEVGQEFRCLDALWVKQSETGVLEALITKFCDEYADHGHKHMVIYGDRNGNNKHILSNKTYYQIIQEKLASRGWSSQLMVEGLDPDHRLKHIAINELLQETNPRLPVIRINRNKCKYLIISMQRAPINPDWTKNKNSEKSKSLPQEQATHLSDCFVAGTMVTTATGQRPIEQVAVGELVLTRAGWKPVTRAWLSRRNVEVGTYLIAGREITCTPEHRIWTKNRGWVEAGHLTASDTFCTLEETNAPLCALNAPPSKASGLSATQKPQMLPTGAISRATGLTGPASLFPLHSIGLCGWTPTALFPKASTSIMSMVTTQITASKTSPALAQLSTLSCIGMRSLPTTRRPASTTCLPLPNQQPQPGTNQTRAVVGTASTARSFGTSGHCSTRCVPGAVMPTKPRTSGAPSCASAPASVTLTPATIAASITNNEPAHPVVINSLSTDTSKPKPAHAHALRVSVGQADVYDLSVAEQHEFFANGILVHNCFDNIVYRKYGKYFGKVSRKSKVYFVG